MKQWLAEAIGTFALVFAGTGAMVVNDALASAGQGAVTHVGIGLTFGLIVMAMIYAIGDISGAHINPAVTIAFAVSKRFSWLRVGPYVAAQLFGALAASGLLRVAFPETSSLGASLPSGEVWQSLLFEIVITFILMFVILNVSTGAKEKGIMAGAAIGGTVALAALFAGPVCGASMNPARSLAPAVVGSQWEAWWVYVVGPLAGAVLAVPAYYAVQPREVADSAKV